MPRQNRIDDSFDGHFRPSQMNSLSSKELLDYSRSQLLEEQTAYANFCADIANGQAFAIYFGNADPLTAKTYFFIALKANILLCVNDGTDQHDFYKTRFGNQQFPTFPTYSIPDDTKPVFFQIAYYMHANELKTGCVFGSGSYMHNVLDITGTTYTERDLWKRYKHLFYQAYAEDAPPMEVYPSDGGLFESGVDQASSFNPVENSLTTWAEMPGIYTAYVDNVGVFLPVGFPIDAEMTSQKEVAEPWLLEYVYCKRNPNAGESQNLSLLQGFAGQVPFVSSVVGGMVSMQQFTRILIPRLRAFGRQMTPAPTYAKYKADMNAHGVTEVLDDLGGTFKKSFASVVMLSNATYEAFVGKLESFNVIPNRNQQGGSEPANYLGKPLEAAPFYSGQTPPRPPRPTGGRPSSRPDAGRPNEDNTIEGPPENLPDLHIGAPGYRPGDENNPYRVFDPIHGHWTYAPTLPTTRRRRRW